ncbi:MAG: ATP-binding protein [Gemmataceae bacterium]|nr:ATP-binding protein [Gemmataceae bacterium]
MNIKRLPAIHHCTSQPLRFFGREAELAMLDHALNGAEPSVAAMIGPGGQGKTAIVQQWLTQVGTRDGVFLWSFYRGKDSDLALREMLAYAEGLDKPPDVSASWCVDRLLAILKTERWALVLDGTEVVQHEQGAWFGRFVHPELGRLLEELASVAIPGVVVLTSRFPMPTLERRRHAQVISLSTLDMVSATSLLKTLGVTGTDPVISAAARSCGLHAKAVELLGTYLVHYHEGRGERYRELPQSALAGGSDEEVCVFRVLQALQAVMPGELQDLLALAISFRQPTTEKRLLDYLQSDPLRHLLHDTWGRCYEPFQARTLDWLQAQLQMLVELRLLERVGQLDEVVLDAHPLVRSGFEYVLGSKHHAHTARAGFLCGRPDRRPALSLEDASEEVELFHAYADAGLWNEADSTFVALDNPKHRFLAPAFERDLLLRFFPNGDWRLPPLWTGFGRYRSLAICFEMLGLFEDAIEAYRPVDAPLRGDALIALGRLQPFLDVPQVSQPWQALWQAYLAHALCLLGKKDEALRVAQSIVPADVYEWVHVFECLLRLGRLDAIDLGSLLYLAPLAEEHHWTRLARQRMRLDYLRVQGQGGADLGKEYRELLDAYDRGGLPFERVLTRLSYGRWLQTAGELEQSRSIVGTALEICRWFGMTILERDCSASDTRP